MMGAVGGPGDPQRARRAAEELAGRGVLGVALTFVDNAGISRVKTVRVGRVGDGDGGRDGEGISPACTGPAYGMTRLVELSGYGRELLAALDEQGVPVEQFHPEYAAGQLELSTAAAGPVAAADRVVLVKETIRAVSQAHGLRASFAPVVVAGRVGNGGHLHCSAWSGGRNLFTGGEGPYGLTGRGQSILAGLLDALPALCAIGA